MQLWSTNLQQQVRKHEVTSHPGIPVQWLSTSCASDANQNDLCHNHQSLWFQTLVLWFETMPVILMTCLLQSDQQYRPRYGNNSLKWTQYKLLTTSAISKNVINALPPQTGLRQSIATHYSWLWWGQTGRRWPWTSESTLRSMIEISPSPNCQQ